MEGLFRRANSCSLTDVFRAIYAFEGKLFLSFLGSLSSLLFNKLVPRADGLCTKFLTDATHHIYTNIECPE